MDAHRPDAETAPDLSGIDTLTLDFERHWWRYAGNRESAIRELFSESPVAYHQRLNRLIDDPAALDHDPQLVRRLRRLRAARRAARSTAA